MTPAVTRIPVSRAACGTARWGCGQGGQGARHQQNARDTMQGYPGCTSEPTGQVMFGHYRTYSGPTLAHGSQGVTHLSSHAKVSPSAPRCPETKHTDVKWLARETACSRGNSAPRQSFWLSQTDQGHCDRANSLSNEGTQAGVKNAWHGAGTVRQQVKAPACGTGIPHGSRLLHFQYTSPL